MNRTRVKRLSLQSRCTGDHQYLVIEKHANAIAGHASSILNIASKTQSAVDTLTVNAAIQAEIHSKQTKAINQSLAGIEENMLHLTRKTDKASAMVRRHAGFVTRHAKTLFCLMKNVKELFPLYVTF
jgi:uncharacterized protein with beta-barrel porin domain